jgi:hypothetical protein
LFTASVLNAMAYSDIDNAQASHATSLYTVVQQLSLSMGSVLAAFVLEGAQSWRPSRPCPSSGSPRCRPRQWRR